MLTLAKYHPICLAVRLARRGHDIARRARQSTSAIFFADTKEQAEHAVELCEEIATDADTLDQTIAEVAADGVITPAERERLSAAAREIRDQAQSGYITGQKCPFLQEGDV